MRPRSYYFKPRASRQPPRPWYLPCILGQESKDCGPAALASIARYYGATISLWRCREAVGTTTQGTSLYGLCQGARALGFDASAGRASVTNLARLPLPAVLLLDSNNFGHFVVLYRTFGRLALIADPNTGLRCVAKSSLAASWNGLVLLLTPTERLKSTDKPVSHLRSLIREAISERWLIPLSLLCGLANLAIAFVTALAVRAVIDSILPSGKYQLLHFWIFAATASFLTAFLINVARDYQTVVIGRRIEWRLACGFLANVFQLPLERVEKFAPGEISSRIPDLVSVRSGVVSSVTCVTLEIASLFILGFLLSLYSLALTFLVFASLLLLAGTFAVFAVLGINTERNSRMHYALFNGVFVDCLTHIKLYKAFNAEEAAQEMLSSHYRKWQSESSRYFLYNASLSTVSAFIVALSSLTLLIYGTFLSMTHEVSVGSMLLFYSVMGMVLSSVQRLSPTIGGIQQACVALARLATFATVEGSSVDATQPHSRCVSRALPAPHIEICSPSFSYSRGTLVLRGGAVSIKRGEWVVLMGNSGVGKSTLACLLSGLYRAAPDQIFVNGQDISTCPPELLRNEVGIVFQDGGVIRGSIEDNIRLGRRSATRDEIEAAARLAQVDHVIRDLPRGYACVVGSGGDTLSSGERQRIAIARAVLKDPAVLILDEATNHLDLNTELQLLAALRNSREGKTTIVITHRRSLALSDSRLLIIEAGVLKDCSSLELQTQTARMGSSGDANGVEHLELPIAGASA